MPLGGGGYFRLLPFPFFKAGMKSVIKKDNAFVFYAHPWEFDPGQPRVEQASKGFKKSMNFLSNEIRVNLYKE